ncbi:hypothetical protein D3C71_1782520 [compost metagenome]
MQRTAQALGKLTIAHRLRSAGIIRTAGVLVLQEKIYQGNLVVYMNPWHPLSAITNRPSQAQFERHTQTRQKAALARQHQARTHQHHTNPQGLCALRGFLPGDAQLTGKVLFDRL